MSTLDKDALAMLTDEERAEVEGSEDLSEQELENLKAIAGDGEGDGDDDDEDDDDGDDEGKDGGDDDKDESKPDEDDDSDVAELKAQRAQEAEAKARPATPRYDAKLPDDFEDQVKSLAEQEKDLKTQFKDGDIDFDEYDEKRDALRAEREKLTIQQTKSEISSEMQAQNAKHQWDDAVNTFLDKAAQGENGIDYRLDTAKGEDLDFFIRALAAKEANSDKSMDWFLTEANRKVRALHDLPANPVAPPANTAQDKAAAASKANAARKPDLSANPKTLADVPGGTGDGDVGSEFASIDRLEGEAFEDAVAKLTPAQRERYLKA